MLTGNLSDGEFTLCSKIPHYIDINRVWYDRDEYHLRAYLALYG